VAALRLRFLPFPFSGGGWTSVAGPAGTLVGALLAVGRGAGDMDPTVGVTSYLPDRQATLVEGWHRLQDCRPHRLVLAQGLDPSREDQRL
jgi:hypothetical protein